MRKVLSLMLLSLAALAAVSACTPKQETGPLPIRWDQESCERCAMAISDRTYAAEVRGAPAGKPTKVHKFDDIGCAVIWLEQQPWKDDPRTEIWVTDWRDGHWIDARTANYVTGKVTPMAYGLGAQSDPADAALDFAAAVKHIHHVEESAHKERGGAMDHEHMHHGNGR